MTEKVRAVAEAEPHVSTQVAMHAIILAKRQPWTVRVLQRRNLEQSMPSSDCLDSSDNEQIRLNLYSVFDQYVRDEDGKGRATVGELSP